MEEHTRSLRPWTARPPGPRRQRRRRRPWRWLLPIAVVAAGAGTAVISSAGEPPPVTPRLPSSPTLAALPVETLPPGISATSIAPATTRPAPTATTTPAASPTPSPTPPPVTTVPPPTTVPPRTVTAVPTTTRPAPSPTATAAALCGAPANPYGYNFCGRGSVVRHPPGDVCTYFTCGRDFWTGTGYLVQCRDSQFLLTGGRHESCNDHGGQWRIVASGP